MKKKVRKILWDGPEVERLRKVRRSIERRFKTLDGLCAHLAKLEHIAEAKAPRAKPAPSRARSVRRTA